MPIHGIGPFLPMTREAIDIFNDIISDEIDSAFASSICCCDFCYDDFTAYWPDVAFREMDFQTQSMEVSYLVENSRLGFYSPAEVSTLRQLVECPRCHQQIQYNVWIYEHRFSDVRYIEESIDEILTLGRTTPFLLLNHDFATRVLAEIQEQAKNSPLIRLDDRLYRGRLVSGITECAQKPTDLKTYNAPPAALVGEGRFNHAGIPVLYVASSAETAAAELGVTGDPCNVGRLRLNKRVRILDLVDIDEDAKGYELLKALASSALLAAPRTGEGWLKRQYVFSRFVADCARSAGFSGIRYGSTKRLNQSNYVFFDHPDDITLIASLEDYETLLCPPAERRY